MRLEDHRRASFEARRRGLAHHDIADGILFILDIVFFGETDQKVDDLALLFRRTRNARDGVELLPHEAGLQRGNF